MTGNYIDLLIAFTTLSLSVIGIIGGASLRILHHRKISLEYLGWGTLLAAVWNISNSELWQNFPNALAADYIAFYTTLLLPIPFFLYLNLIQQKRFQRLYLLMTWIVLFECVIFSVLHFAKLLDFKKDIPFILFLFTLFLIVMMGTILTDLVQKRIKSYLPAALGMCVVGIISLTRVVPFSCCTARYEKMLYCHLG